jgi:hypothetical protein
MGTPPPFGLPVNGDSNIIGASSEHLFIQTTV